MIKWKEIHPNDLHFHTVTSGGKLAASISNMLTHISITIHLSCKQNYFLSTTIKTAEDLTKFVEKAFSNDNIYSFRM